MPNSHSNNERVSDPLHVYGRLYEPMQPPHHTSMLLFYCASDQEVKSIGASGLQAESGALRLYERFDEADAACDEAVIVIDYFSLPDPEPAEIRHVPPEAIRNVEPHLPPKAVTAAGGFVTRRRAGELDLLLIHRRGVWDLPKGKLDVNESIEACALREVREELGIERLKASRPLGETVHGYAEKGSYIVKTTHWFEMSTSADRFRPQASEDIEAAEWVPWPEARERVGFETLRRHMARVEHLISGGD